MSSTFVLPRGTIVADPLVVRVAGLPATTLGPVRFDQTSARIGQLVESHEVLRLDGNSIADDLYDVIADSSMARQKANLIGLRRAMHNMRTPDRTEWNPSIAEAVGADMAGRVDDWMTRLRETQSLRAQLPDLMATEEVDKRSKLRELAVDHGFRRALALSSPALSKELTKWLSDPTYQPRRRSLKKLMTYAARAATRTSPFSTFTVIGAASWSVGGQSVNFIDPLPTVTAVSEMYGGLLRQLTRALCERDRVEGELRVRVNPSATTIDDTIRFLGPPPKESIISLPASPAVLYCIRLIEEKQVTTLNDLRKALGAKVGDVGRAEHFLQRLVQAGLVERTSPVADLAADPLGDLADWLARHAPDEFADVRPSLTRVRTELASPAPIADVAGHERQQRALRIATRDLARAAGLSPDAMDGQEKEAFFENAVYPTPVATCSMQRWRSALTDLDTVRRMMAPFDPGLPLRVALGAYCRDRFGAGSRVPLISLHAALAEELRDVTGSGRAVQEIAVFLGVAPTPETGLAGSPMARLRELGEIRSSVRALIARREAREHVRWLDPVDVESCAASWPDWVATPRSVAFYVQLRTGPELNPESHSVVVNAAHGGYGRGRTRATHLIHRAGGTGRIGTAHHEGSTFGNVVLAELGGLFGFSPNVRQPCVSHEIDYPYTSSTRPDASRIQLSDLFVMHDPDSDMARLTSQELGVDVIPLNLGMLSEQILPPAARLANDAFGQKSFPPFNQWFPAEGDESLDVTDTGSHILLQDRLEVGRVTLRRARWIVPRAQLPIRTKGQGDADHLVHLSHWLRAHGIPERCFVRSLTAEDGSTGQARVAKALATKPNKPLYVDFANLYLVGELERMLHRSQASVAFEEALPAPEDSIGPNVTEFLVELSEGVSYQ